jgi:hypothetical protein
VYLWNETQNVGEEWIGGCGRCERKERSTRKVEGVIRDYHAAYEGQKTEMDGSVLRAGGKAARADP